MLNSGYCRLCAEIKLYSNLSVIKNEDEYSKNLCNQISQCFQIQILDDDNLPKTVCLDCCTQTNVTYEFFNKVQRAQEFLRNVIYKPLINNSPAIAFIQPVVGLITNENNTEDLIRKGVESDTDTEEDKHFENDDLRDSESSRDSTNVQSSSTSYIPNKNVKKVEEQSKKDEVKIEIKSEINSNEINSLQSDDGKKIKRRRKISENRKKIRQALKDYKWICHICSVELSSRYQLIDHFQQKHNKAAEYKCSLCPKYFTIYPSFAEHIQRHKNYNKFCCDECGRRFADKRILKRHMNTVHSDIRHACDICKRTFKTSKGFENHKKYHLPKKVREIAKIRCKICHIKIATEDDLNEHVKVHDESNKHFTCEKCGARFRTLPNLKSHVESKHTEYTEDQYVQCPLCPAKFKFKAQLARHRRFVHYPRNFYECESCDKKFNLITAYKKHRMLHTGERPYKCEHCDKAFRDKKDLQVHNRQHTGEKPYCCSDCKHYFTNLPNYIKHMRNKHGVTSFKNVKKVC